ncbi:MAG: hypothetical protein L0Y56_15895 [Nitrospira sp.]|nr:hypothetical protein [Nitrospira sp.]
MKCPKCENLMVTERFTDDQQTGKFSFIGWRCLSCGLILDPTILLNRSQKKSEGVSKSGKKVLAGIKN